MILKHFVLLSTFLLLLHVTLATLEYDDNKTLAATTTTKPPATTIPATTKPATTKPPTTKPPTTKPFCQVSELYIYVPLGSCDCPPGSIGKFKIETINGKETFTAQRCIPGPTTTPATPTPINRSGPQSLQPIKACINPDMRIKLRGGKCYDAKERELKKAYYTSEREKVKMDFSKLVYTPLDYKTDLMILSAYIFSTQMVAVQNFESIFQKQPEEKSNLYNSIIGISKDVVSNMIPFGDTAIFLLDLMVNIVNTIEESKVEAREEDYHVGHQAILLRNILNDIQTSAYLNISTQVQNYEKNLKINQQTSQKQAYNEITNSWNSIGSKEYVERKFIEDFMNEKGYYFQLSFEENNFNSEFKGWAVRSSTEKSGNEATLLSITKGISLATNGCIDISSWKVQKRLYLETKLYQGSLHMCSKTELIFDKYNIQGECKVQVPGTNQADYFPKYGGCLGCFGPTFDRFKKCGIDINVKPLRLLEILPDDPIYIPELRNA